MERVKVILNPYSGRGAAVRYKEQMFAALARAGVAYDLVETTGVGHAVELAKQAYGEGYSLLVAAGGDGTASEVMNGLAQATPTGQTVRKLALFPLGSGNDIAAMLGYPEEPDAIARLIASGRTRHVDLGYVQLYGADRNIDRYFVNNLGLGFEAQVTLESYKIRNMRGILLYGTATIRAMHTFLSQQVEIVWKMPGGKEERRQQAILMVSVGNSARTGGGFFLTPDAVMDDGLFDVALTNALPRWRVLALLPKALKGKHTTDPAVTMLRCCSLEVTCQGTGSVPVHLDGEVMMTNARRVMIEMQAGRLEIVA